MTAAAPLTLAQMTQRRDELDADLQTAQAELLTAQEGLISGTTKPQAVTALQSTVTALQGALDTADERVAQLSEAEAQRKAEQHREALLTKLVQGAERATEHRATFADVLSKALLTLAPQLEAAFGELYDLHDLRESWVQTLRELDSALPGAGMALTLVQAQTDCSAVELLPFPASWHHGFVNSSTADQLTPEQRAMWRTHFDLVRAGRLPRRGLTGVGQLSD